MGGNHARNFFLMHEVRIVNRGYHSKQNARHLKTFHLQALRLQGVHLQQQL